MELSTVYFTIIFSCGIVHLVLTAVMSLFARHRVKYLAIAWIMGIFAFGAFAISPYASTEEAHPGVMHPAMLISLVIISYLQSIYPLSIPMPGYLQWGRMWKYAFPAIVFIVFYLLGYVMGSKVVTVENFNDFRANLFSSDLLIRMGMLLTSFYYIINIFRLPRRLSHANFPKYLYAYSLLLGLSAVYFLFIAFNYKIYLMMIYIIIFTLLNAYLCMRVLETMALELPKPVIREVAEIPSDEELKKSEDDFNEANRQRFQRMEYWMQKNVTRWTESTFNRDDLCRETGINRHNMLQTVRSQGYNNVHEFINQYRVDELKRRIRQGAVTSLSDCLEVGFGTIKTARACFIRIDGGSLDQYMQKFISTT